VGEAIESALSQTYAHKEVIVIDDGSTDGSLEVIRSFGDAIRWQTGPNRGGSAARNRGIELAQGELIQFLDADDLLHSQKLELQVAELQRSDADLVFCDGDVYAGREMIGRFARGYEGGDPVVFVLKGILFTPSVIHYRQNLVNVGGFREDLPCAQERDLHLRLACVGLTFHHLPQTLFTVRKLSKSISSDSTRVLDQHSSIAWRTYNLLQKSGNLTEERCVAIAGLLASDARAYLRHGLREKAGDYFEQAFRIHPDGGIPQAYSRRTRWLRAWAGPILTEKLVGLKRAVV
jgi:glycosyltransferase involved in cell wall biosynthesis